MAQRGKSISISTGILPPNQRTNSPGKTDGRRESDVKPAAGGRRGSVFGGGPLKSNTIKGGVLSNSQSNADSTLHELPTKAIIDSLPIMARGINTAELHEKGGGKYFSISDLTMIHRKASKIHVPKMDNMSSFMRNKNRESLVEKRKSLLTESISEETSTAKDAPHRKSISSFTPTKEYPKLANSIQQSLKGMTKSLEDKIDVLIEKGPLNDAALDLLIELEAKYESRINSPEMHRPEIEPGTRPKVLAEQR